MGRSRRNHGKYILLSILGLIAIIIVLNFSKIKFAFNMMQSYRSLGYEDSNDEFNDSEAPENPLLAIIEEGGPEAQIVEKYNDNFELMQKDYEAKLDSLLKIGYEEYKSGHISTAKLGNRMLNEGSRLEKKCDSDFNAMVKEMKEELKANNHDPGMVKDLEEYYNSYKQAEKSKLMKKAKKHVD